jgi:hypothetical protein
LAILVQLLALALTKPIKFVLCLTANGYKVHRS